MKLAPDYIRAAKNSISGKWEVRLNSRLQSEHATFSQAENKAHHIALKYADHGKDCEISLDIRGA